MSCPDAIALGVFSLDESLAFLSKHGDQFCPEEAIRAAEGLGYLPLALDLVAGYAKETPIVPEGDFQGRFYPWRSQLPTSSPLPPRTSRSILAELWRFLSWNLQQKKPLIPVLFRAFYLAPDQIPRALLSEEGLAHSELDAILESLERQHLLKPGKSPGTFSIHPLLQEVGRDPRFLYVNQQKVMDTVQVNLKKEWTFDLKNQDTWGRSKKLLPHLKAFLKLVEMNKQKESFFFNPDTVCSFFNDVGNYFHRLEADFSSSINYLTQSLRSAAFPHQDHAFRICAILTNLALAHESQGNLSQAVEYFKDVLDISQGFYGENHPLVADTLDSLGDISQVLNEFPPPRSSEPLLTESYHFYSRSLGIRRKIHGDNHLDVAKSLFKLVKIEIKRKTVYRVFELFKEALEILDRGIEGENPLLIEVQNEFATYLNDFGNNVLSYRASEAISYFSRAVVLRRKIYGDEHAEVADSLQGLGSSYLKQRNFPEALNYLKEALGIRKKIFGNEHSNVADSLNELGATLLNQEDFPQAIDHFKEALRIRRRIYGNEHCDVLNSLENLGNAFLKQQDFLQGVECFKEVFEIRERVLGSGHPELVYDLNNLGNAFLKQKNFLKAVECFTESLKTRKEVFAEEDFEVGSSLKDLGNVYFEQGDFLQAIKFYEEALRNWKACDCFHLDMPATLHSLGSAYLQQGDFSKAVVSFTEALESWNEHGYNYLDPMNTRDHHSDIVSCGCHQNNLSETINRYEKDLVIRKKKKGGESTSADILHHLGAAHFEQRNFSRASESYKEAFLIRERVYGDLHPEVAKSLQGLGSSLKKQVEAHELYLTRVLRW